MDQERITCKELFSGKVTDCSHRSEQQFRTFPTREMASLLNNVRSKGENIPQLVTLRSLYCWITLKLKQCVHYLFHSLLSCGSNVISVWLLMCSFSFEETEIEEIRVKNGFKVEVKLGLPSFSQH